MILSLFKTPFSKLKQALTKSRNFFSSRLKNFFKGSLDEDTEEELVRMFYEADFGPALSFELVQKLKKASKKTDNLSIENLLEIILRILKFLLM